MAARSSAKTSADNTAKAAGEPTVELTTTVVVQWPQASVYLGDDFTGDGAPGTVRIPNTGRDADVNGGHVTVYRGEILPAEAPPEQRALLLEIGAAAGVAFAQPAAAPAADGGPVEPVID